VERSLRVPNETVNEWLRFVVTQPPLEEWAAWLSVKAMEIGWDALELGGVLMAICRPEFYAEPKKAN
jgi:hydroxylamine reductase (hybrid-cluster protein)